ncbi:MAG: prolipoprotein diacylglyceryl transferase [Myxococcota bacterium]
MLPVLYRIQSTSEFSKVVILLVALALVAWVARSGWKGAGGVDAQGKPIEPTKEERRNRAILYGVIATGLAFWGLTYALPEIPILHIKGKGEGIPIHTYGLLIGAGFITAVTAAGWLATREWPGKLGLERRDQVFDFAFWAFIGGIVGSRVLFIIVNWKDYAAQPSKIFDLGGGLVFYGGLIGAVIAAIWFTRKNDIDFWRFADVCIPTVSLGQAFGRLGCFSAGCCWGRITTHEHAPFAVEFPGVGLVKDLFGNAGTTASLAFQSQADTLNETRWVVEATGEVTAQAQAGAVRISDWALSHGHTLPVHPTQLYESFGQILLFMLLLAMRRFRRFHGQILAIWLMCYAVLRSSVELFRGDLERGTLHGLISSVPFDAWYNISTSQFISIAMFSLGAYVLVRNLRAVNAQPKVDLAAVTAA